MRLWLALLAALSLFAASCSDSDDSDDSAGGDDPAPATTEPTLDTIPEDLSGTDDSPTETTAAPATTAPMDEGPAMGGTLVVAQGTLPPHFNGNIASGTPPNTVGAQLFASLLLYDGDWNAQPYLAESWEFSDDALTLTITIRDNAVFHDGEPIESHDVAFSLNMAKENHPFKPMFGSVTSVDTPDPTTVVINLSQPHPAILIALGPGLLKIFPEHVYGEVENIRDCTCNNTPGDLVGSGPFTLEEFDTTNGIVRMAAFEDFFLGRAYVDELVMVTRPAANEALTEMENGEIHVANVQGVADLERASSIDSLTVTPRGFEGIGAVVSVQFNVEHEITGIKEVRQAIAYAIDKDFIINELHSGLPFRAKSPIHPGSPYYDDSIEGYELDLAKSAELLDAAGFPADGSGDRGITLTLDAIPAANDYQSVVAEYIKSALSEVGINVELRSSPDFGTWAGYLAGRQYSMTMQILFMWADPIIGVHRSFLEANIQPIPFANNSAYINPELEAKMNTAGAEQDQAARTALYAEIQAELADDLPFHWIETLPTNQVYITDLVNNPPLTIWGNMSPMHEVWLTQ